MKVPIPEDHPKEPVNPYGETKLAMERALQWYGNAYGLKWVALRYFNAAGADPDGEIGEAHDPEAHLIPLTIQAALGQRTHVEIYGTDYPTPDGTAIRDYIHVTDLGDAHVRALDYLAGGGESRALNLGTGQGYSVREVINAAGKISGHPVPFREVPRRAGDPPVLVADASHAGSDARLETATFRPGNHPSGCLELAFGRQAGSVDARRIGVVFRAIDSAWNHRGASSKAGHRPGLLPHLFGLLTRKFLLFCHQKLSRRQKHFRRRKHHS